MKKYLKITIVAATLISIAIFSQKQATTSRANRDRERLIQLNREQWEIGTQLRADWPQSLHDMPAEREKFNENACEINWIISRHPNWTHEEVTEK